MVVGVLSGLRDKQRPGAVAGAGGGHRRRPNGQVVRPSDAVQPPAVHDACAVVKWSHQHTSAGNNLLQKQNMCGQVSNRTCNDL